MEGLALVNNIIEATGLPADWAKTRLIKLIESHGLQVESLKFDQLRGILSEFLQDTVIEMTNEKGP